MPFLDHLMSFPWMKPLGWALIHFLWQGTLIGIATMATLRVGQYSPPVRYLIGLAAMFICALAPVTNFLVLAKPWEKPTPIVLKNAEPELSLQVSQAEALPAATAGAAAPAVTTPPIEPPAGNSETKTTNHVRWSILPDLVSWFVVLWFSGVFVLALRLAIAWLRIQGWWRKAQPAGERWLEETVERLSKALGVRANIRARVSTAIPGALTLGFLKPVILLPARLITGLPREQVEAIIAHELAHIRRHDYLVNLIQSVVEVVLFYHPVIWWLSREIRQAREECCDELASMACGNRKTYATALASIAALQLNPALGAGGGSILSRIYRLAGKSTRDPLFSAKNAAWLLSLLTVAFTSWVVLFSGRLVAQDAVKIANTKQAPIGRVIDENGKPVNNAEIILYHTKSRWGMGNRVVERIKTSEEGRFAFKSRLEYETPFGSEDSDHYLIFANANGKAVAGTVIAGGTADRKTYELTLTSPRSQTFVVVDKAGKPMPGVKVRLASASSRERTGRIDYFLIQEDIGICSALTDANGRATLTNLPDGVCYMEAEKDGFEESFPCTTSSQGEQQFVLLPEATLEGRVLDPFGTPVEGAVVWLLPKFNWHHYFVAKTGRDGRYKVHKIWSDGKEADWGRYEVGIQHPAFTARTREVKFAPGEAKAAFDITVEPGVKLEGTLVDSSGKSIAGGEVAVDSGSGRQHVFSDAIGKFQCRVVAGKIFAFCLAAPGGHYFVDEQYGRVQTLAFGSTLEMRLSYGVPVGLLGRVTGKVESSSGTPATGCEVKIVPKAGFLRTSPFHRGDERGIRTDAEGAFEARAVPIGLTAVIKAEAGKGKEIGVYEEDIRTDGQVLARAVRLENTSAAKLRIYDEHEKPLANTGIFIEPMASGMSLSTQTIQTDREGMLSIPNVLAGVKYKLSIARDTSIAPPPPNDAVVELVNKEGQPSVSRLLLSDKLTVKLERANGEVYPIKSFKDYSVATSGGYNWSNGRIQLLGEKDGGVVVSRKFFVLGSPGNKVAAQVETKDGSIVEAEGTLPAIPSEPLLLKARAPIAKPTASPASGGFVAAAGEIAGRVLDPEGKPVEGAMVTEGAGRTPGDAKPWKTGPDGIFRIPPEESDHLVYLTIFKGGFGPVFLTDFDKGKAFEVKLQNTARIRGQVIGGAPGKVRILLEKNKPTKRERMGFEVNGIQFQTETGPDGSYDFPMESGTYRYSLQSADGRYAQGEVTVTENEATSLNEPLRKGYPVSFELVDCQSGEPVEGLELFIIEELDAYAQGLLPDSQRNSDKQGRTTWENVRPGITAFSGTRLFHSGTGQSPFCRWWREDKLQSPRIIDYTVKRPVKDEGTYSIHVDVRENVAPIRILLERGVKVSGKITNSEGGPIPNLAVTVVPNDDSGSLTGDSRFAMETHRDGTFAGFIPAGNGVVYNLSAFALENETTLSNIVSEPFGSKPGDELKFELKALPGGWISGRLVDTHGEPLAETEILAGNQDERDHPISIKKAVTDTQGKFRVGPLRDGHYLLKLDSGATLNTPAILVRGKEERDAGILTLNEPK